MREHVYDGIGGPFDCALNAPDACVVCGDVLVENDHGEVRGYDDDGCTCSPTCHAEWLRRIGKQRADDRAADEAMFATWDDGAVSERSQ